VEEQRSGDREPLQRTSNSGEPSQPKGGEAPHRGVALLLTGAAVLAALIGARASVLSANASTSWQQGTREKVKEASAYVESIRYIYGVEVPRAMLVTEMRFRVDELSNLPKVEQLKEDLQRSIAVEKEIQQNMLDQIAAASVLGSEPKYRTDLGFDPALMLADDRANMPASLLSVDPEATKELGDETGDKAIRMISATIFISFAFLCGSMARGFPRRRRQWLASGIVFLGAGLVAAIVFEVL
jgi:hypothetical protein